MFRFSNALKFFAVSTLLAGCAGEDAATQELVPAKLFNLRPVEKERLSTVKQEISSLGYSTYLGFGGDEYGTAIASDSAGNTYITGTTTSFGGTVNVFVAKMSPTGTNVYFTYFPGTQSQAIAVDGSGNTYIASTGSAGPTVTKIDPTGTTILYSVSLSWNTLSGIKADNAGNAYLTGSVNNGAAGVDVAVGKVNPTGTAFVYAVAFGGTGTDTGAGIAVDSVGSTYIVGTTTSTNFPLANATQTTLRGPQDAFVARLSPTGTTFFFSTYLGGNTYDWGSAIALDTSGSAYVTGTTAALAGVESFPVTSGAAQVSPGGGGDAFVAQFGYTGSRYYASYIGGSGSETGTGIVVNASGGAFVTGYTNSTNFPTTATAYQRFAPAGTNAFVAQLSPAGNYFGYATYLGGSNADIGAAIAMDSSNNAYVTGNTLSSNFPTSVYAPGGSYDAFVVRLNGP